LNTIKFNKQVITG